MAWTHFTAALGPGEELTGAMYGELLAAFEERLKAIGGVGSQIDDTVQGPLTASGLATARVAFLERQRTGYAYAASLTPWRVLLHEAVGRISVWYAEDTSLATAWDADGLLTAAAWASGLSSTEWEAVAAATAEGVADRRYFNVVREAIRLLDRVALAMTPASLGVESYTRRGDAPVPSPDYFAAAVADFFTKGDSYNGAYGTMSASAFWSNFYTLEAYRAEADWVVPALPAFAAGYEVGLRVSWNRSVEANASGWVWSWGGVDHPLADLGVGAGSAAVTDAVEGSTLTGTVASGLKMAAHDSAAGWNSYAVFGSQVVVGLASAWARPTWVYG